MTTLESRYRRLLSWYPADHRDRFGDEMLGVLMDGAEPGQRRPRLGESFDLMRNAVWKRIGQTRESTADGSPWAKAGAVVGLLASMLMFAGHGANSSAELAMRSVMDRTWPLPIASWTLAAIWLVITLIVLSGRQAIAIGFAWLTAIAEIWWSYFLAAVPVDMVFRYEYVVAGLTAAIGLTIARTGLSGARLLGRRGIVATFGVALLVIGGGFFNLPSGLLALGQVWAMRSLLLLAGGTLLVLVWRLGGPVRRRVLTMAMPAIAVHFGFSYGTGEYFSVTVDEMLAVPFIVLAVSLAAMLLWERILHSMRKAPPSTGTDNPVK